MRRAIVAIIVVALAAGVAGWFLGRGAVRAAPPVNTGAPAVVTVAPQERALTESLTLRGQLQPAPTQPVLSGGSGRVTGLLSADSSVSGGTLLGEIDGEPVIALVGEHPYWRDMAVGSKGADVAQLQQQLLALGYDPGAVDGTFGPSTLAAWNELRSTFGYPRVSAVGPTTALVVPFEESLPIAELEVAVGDFVTPGTPLLSVVTGEALIAVPLPAESVALLSIGAQVVVEGEVPGSVIALESTESGTVALVTPEGAVISAAPLVQVLLAESDSSALIVPTLALRSDPAGATWVMVLGDGGSERRVEVEVDLMVAGEAAVRGELTVEDRVVLSSADQHPSDDGSPTAGAGPTSDADAGGS